MSATEPIPIIKTKQTNKNKIMWMDWLALISWQIDAARLNAEFKEPLIVGISSWFLGADFQEASAEWSYSWICFNPIVSPSTHSKCSGWLRGHRTHWLDASLQCEAWGRGGDESLRGFNVVTALLYLHSVQMATRVQMNACPRPRLIDAQTQQPPSLFTSFPTVDCRNHICAHSQTPDFYS